MASKTELIIDHFTGDADLKAKIMAQVERVRAGAMTVDEVIAEHTTDPKITAKIKEIIGKVKAGHSVHSITGYHHADPKKAQSTAENILKHHGVVHNILNS